MPSRKKEKLPKSDILVDVVDKVDMDRLMTDAMDKFAEQVCHMHRTTQNVFCFLHNDAFCTRFLISLKQSHIQGQQKERKKKWSQMKFFSL
jgi:hypothetical protein